MDRLQVARLQMSATELSHWRLIGSIVLAVLVIVIVEINIYWHFQPTFWERTSWFLHDPYRGESFDRLVLSEKLQAVENANPDFITVGDSSGFFSLNPEIIDTYLPGKHLFNTSTGANHAFDGYFATAEYVLRRKPSVKHVVLHMYPGLVPARQVIDKGDLGSIAATQLDSIKGLIEAQPRALFSYNAKLLS